MQQVLRRYCALTIVGFLASCGGGGSGGDGGDGAAVSSDTVRLTFNVVDKQTRSAVFGANVNFQAGVAQYATTTDANGSGELTLPSSQVAGVIYPAASVQKPGYEPQTGLYSELKAGRTYSQAVELIPLAPSVSIPVGGEFVMHLGDGLFEGDINSQFQKATDGASLTFAITDWAAKVQAGFTTATVYLDAKGWQTDVCANTIELVGDVGTVTLPGGVSPTSGFWGGGTQVPFEFSIAKVGGQRAALRITSGACSGTTDLDDFEINRIRVYFSI